MAFYFHKAGDRCISFLVFLTFFFSIIKSFILRVLPWNLLEVNKCLYFKDNIQLTMSVVTVSAPKN